jgi:gliding motility-associated-like protein
MKSGFLLSFMITWFFIPNVFGQNTQHTYRFYEDLKVSAPECGPALIPANHPGNCNAESVSGTYPDDSPPCRVQRKVYKNEPNWGLIYPNTDGLITENYTIQIYLRITEWGSAVTKILDFGTGGEGIYFTKSPTNDERCLLLSSAGVAGPCPFFNTNNYYLFTFTRNSQNSEFSVYVNDQLFIRYIDSENLFTASAGSPVNLFMNGDLQSCESTRINFAYLAFNTKYTTAEEVNRNYDDICFTANINSAADFSIDPNPSCGFPKNITINYTGSIASPGTGHKFEWDWDGATVVSGNGMGPYVVNWKSPGPKNVSLTVTNLTCNNSITNKKITTISSLDLTSQVTEPTCTDSLATIILSAVDGITPFQFSIDSVNYQNSASFRVSDGKYRVFVKDGNGCVSSKNITITPVETIFLNTIGDTTVCEGQIVPLITGSNANSFSWQPATYLDDSFVMEPSATPSVTTQYIVTGDKNGCIVTDTVRITVIPKIIINVTPDTEIEPEVPFQLEAASAQLNGVAGVNYQWFPPTGLDNAHIHNPTATLLSSQTYTVRGYSPVGCYGEARVVLSVLPPNGVSIPSAFSPNADGINEILKLNNRGIQELRYFKIYNRWGQLVFQTTQLDGGWDGRFNGAEPVAGIYTYEYLGTTFEGKLIRKEGSVLLIR